MSAVTNKEIRARANDAVNFNIGRVILLAATAVGVPALIYFFGATSNIITTFSGMLDRIVRYGADYYSNEAIVGAFAAAFGSVGLFSVLASLASMVLRVGHMRGLQRLAHHEPVKASVLLPHWKHIPGCIGLQMWLGLKTFAWALPGLLVDLLGSMLASEGAALGELLQTIGGILYLVLVIRASYHYMLACHIYAETPEVGVYDAVERSKTIMATRKWQLFCLTLPHALGVIGVWVAFFLLTVLFAMVNFSGAFAIWFLMVLIVAAITATAYLLMLANMAVACYYLAHK